MQQLITRLDIAVPQVLIEARIVEAQDSFGSSLGVKLGAGFPSFGIGGGGRGVAAPTYETAVGQRNTGATSDLPFVNLPSQGAGGFPAARWRSEPFSWTSLSSNAWSRGRLPFLALT